MKRMHVQGMVAGLLIACLSMSASAADVGRVLRSSAFPGMGQLGDGQKARGLLYMSGEILLLSLTVDRIVKKAAYDRETEYLQVKLGLAQSYDEKVELTEKWQEAYDASGQAAILSYAFAGGAVLLWAWNIIDAVVLAPAASEDALLQKVKENTTVAVGFDKAQVSYRIDF